MLHDKTRFLTFPFVENWFPRARFRFKLYALSFL